MQVRNVFVNTFVVNILMHYKICSFNTRRSIRDRKVSDYVACDGIESRENRQRGYRSGYTKSGVGYLAGRT